MRRRLLPLLAFLSVCAAAPWSAADAQQPQAENLQQLQSTVISLIRALVDQKILTPEKAAELLRQAGIEPSILAQKPAPGAAPAGGGGAAALPAPAAAIVTAPQAAPPEAPAVRVPYVPEIVKREIREELKQEIVAQARAEGWAQPGALPEWLNRISLYGDTRVRMTSDRLDSANEPLAQAIDAAYQLPAGTTKSDTEARDRIKVRARIGLDAKLSDALRTDIRISTSNGGDANNAFTEDVVLGQYNRRLGVGLDLAYVQWDPLRSLTLRGGRIANPYYATDLIWAPDLTFDGAAITFRPRLSESWSLFTTLGAHPILATTATPASDAWNEWLYAAQVGLQADWTSRSSLTLAAAYYDFSNIEGKLNPLNSAQYNNAVPLFRQGGNTMFDINILNDANGAPSYALASKFRVFDAIAKYEWGRFDPVRIGLTGEYVRNFGFNAAEITRRIGVAGVCTTGTVSSCALPQDRTGATGLQRPRTAGYMGLLQVGNPTVAERNQWQAFFGYRYLERDATVDSFTSPDYRFGGTDQKSPFVGFTYGVARGTTTTIRYISAKSLDLAPRYNDDTWFFDVVSRF